ncbi:uncharacterized protein LOC116180362 isoform X2 [Photinus pyralis]|uniref:uncharacterized protein LOC116180362 isoform X2 n=1 Tax=Photinus pyralis TaxID=7054 RepID=UPI001266FE2E|nr:uncharacterized protein LOC116180362 isoform X2 [Photinus pyralis]
MNLDFRELKVPDSSSHTTKPSCISAIHLWLVTQVERNDDDFSLGEALQSYHPLLEHVFTYLDKASLQCARCTCTIWNELATKELNKRISPSWIAFYPNGRLTCSRGFSYTNVSFGIFAYNPKLVKLDGTLCVHGLSDETKMSEYFESITEARLRYCVIACPSLTPIVPSTSADQLAVGFQGLFVPRIPHVETHMFRSNAKSAPTFRSGAAPRLRVKCCIIFSGSTVRLLEPFLRAYLAAERPESVALGGGFIYNKKSLQMPEGERFKDSEIFCMAFLQADGAEANFAAHSVVIVNETEDEVGFVNELVQFKEGLVLHKYGVLFRFCCKAKTWKVDESDIIRRHFPDFVLYGMDVNGEIGWNTGNGSTTTEELPSAKKRRKKDLPPYVYGWSTVLVLLTWNKK